MLKAYKFRLYPNKEQEELIQKTFGCCRFVYNQTLSYRKEIYETQKKSMNKTSCNDYCNQVLKKEYKWLKEVDKFALTNAIYNMNSAYQRFFKGYSNYPKFKSKRNNKKSYSTNFTNNNIEISFESNKIKLPKLKWVKTKIHREFVGKIKSATVSQVSSGKYYISILVEQEIKELPKNEFTVGIDLGLTDFAITSDGVKYSNPRYLRKSLNKLAKEQRKLSRKKKGSKNRNKQRIKVARVHEKITNQRKDFLHKLSSELINENQVICLEDLQVKEIQQNKYLSQSVSDVGWYEFRRQLEYKAKWYGRTISFVDKWYPSSQICSNCGNNTGKKTLDIREFDCPYCGRHHDRDINASINILNEGLRILNNK
jgi:putative transposase|nr:MAG TPA_asm: endonuclease [Caudoviricetes sp.]